MFIRENISTKGKGVIDTFHLPYSYKFDNFCDFVFYEENYAKFKQVGLRAELQPIKIKLRQQVVGFLMEFFE